MEDLEYFASIFSVDVPGLASRGEERHLNMVTIGVEIIQRRFRVHQHDVLVFAACEVVVLEQEGDAMHAGGVSLVAVSEG